MGQKLSSGNFEKRWYEYDRNKFDYQSNIRLPIGTCLLICQNICKDLHEKKEVELKDLEKIAFKGEGRTEERSSFGSSGERGRNSVHFIDTKILKIKEP